MLFGALVLIAVDVASTASPATSQFRLLAGLTIALLSLPGLALLGAGLTSAALGSRWSAASAGLAMAVGVPVAAVTSAMIGALVVGAFFGGAGRAADVAGAVLRAGVTAAVWISPLIAVASLVWVLLVRRLARPPRSVTADEVVAAQIRPGRGPRRRRG